MKKSVVNGTRTPENSACSQSPTGTKRKAMNSATTASKRMKMVLPR
jgi:hypothetical protein